MTFFDELFLKEMRVLGRWGLWGRMEVGIVMLLVFFITIPGFL